MLLLAYSTPLEKAILRTFFLPEMLVDLVQNTFIIYTSVPRYQTTIQLKTVHSQESLSKCFMWGDKVDGNNSIPR